ncbi:amidase [Arthrobacter zhaoguopingii]|uniref:amidase n=1 Tax=Arthrobacter zhaoguopingii TaxID=2681491 RepID=UPI00135A8F61|nr:amidase [Arthrobacter zhaoguopingii]
MSAERAFPDGIDEASGLIHRREASSRELTELYLERIAVAEPQLNAFITVAADKARAAADAADAMLAAGYDLGILHGLPFAVKDNIDTEGIRTTSGSGFLRGNVPATDATVIRRLKRAGAVVVGKTNLHEFAWGGTTENEHYGPTRNPWDLSRNAAGSSGGSAAAVAADEALFALGTDTGGSVRLPAAATGITGLRPTLGRVSNAGVFPLAWSMDTVGAMARTARDVAVVHTAIAGCDPADPSTSSRPVPETPRPLVNLRGLRLGVVTDFAFPGVDPAVVAATHKALEDLEAAGPQVIPLAMPRLGEYYDAWLTVHIAEPSAVHQQLLRNHAAEYGQDVRALLQAGELILATDYLQAQRYRQQLREEFLTVFDGIDAFITPTAASPCSPLGSSPLEIARTMVTPDGTPRFFTGLASVLGMPALSVPCGMADGVPIGLQIMGRPHDETGILQIAMAYQELTSWHRQRPPALDSGTDTLRMLAVPPAGGR